MRILSSCSDKSCSDSQTLAESSKVPKWYQIKNDINDRNDNDSNDRHERNYRNYRNVAALTTPKIGFIVVLAMFLNKCF